MWICPRCGREFKRTNQGHYCGKAPKTVLEYIDTQPIETHSHLKEMMNAIKNSVPCVNERILWSMPYYEKEGKSISRYTLLAERFDLCLQRTFCQGIFFTYRL